MLKSARHFTLVAGVVLAFLINPLLLRAQQSDAGYELRPAPDLWYNDVDGIRLGLRLSGRVPASFEEVPHRLDLGIWVGSWFPEHPFSYHLTLTEPIPALSDYGSEATIQLHSSVRTGFHRHGISFNKRWQPGFNEDHYQAISAAFHAEDRFADSYLLYPQLWSDEWLYLAKLSFNIQNKNSLGDYSASTNNAISLGGPGGGFIQSRFELRQQLALGGEFELHTRLFAGLASSGTPRQYLFSRSFRPAVGWMENGLSRAKGTIPTPWMRAGLFQVAGGANLRGYTARDFESMEAGNVPLFNSMGAVNIELDYPNPLDRAIRQVPVIGDLVRMRSYLFYDAGSPLGISGGESMRLFADAGTGFQLSLNIPDYLGRPRGLVLRYDIPFWLSDPGGEPSLSFRNIIGVGAVIAI